MELYQWVHVPCNHKHSIRYERTIGTKRYILYIYITPDKIKSYAVYTNLFYELHSTILTPQVLTSSINISLILKKIGIELCILSL